MLFFLPPPGCLTHAQPSLTRFLKGEAAPCSDPENKIWSGKADLSPSSKDLKGPPYISKDLEEFDMATKQLVSIHQHEAEMHTNDDLSQANIAPKTD